MTSALSQVSEDSLSRVCKCQSRIPGCLPTLDISLPQEASLGLCRPGQEAAGLRLELHFGAKKEALRVSLL